MVNLKTEKLMGEILKEKGWKFIPSHDGGVGGAAIPESWENEEGDYFFGDINDFPYYDELLEELPGPELDLEIARVLGWTDIVFRGIEHPRERDYIGKHESCRPQGATGIWSGPIAKCSLSLDVIQKVAVDNFRFRYQWIEFQFALDRETDIRYDYVFQLPPRIWCVAFLKTWKKINK